MIPRLSYFQTFLCCSILCIKTISSESEPTAVPSLPLSTYKSRIRFISETPETTTEESVIHEDVTEDIVNIITSMKKRICHLNLLLRITQPL